MQEQTQTTLKKEMEKGAGKAAKAPKKDNNEDVEMLVKDFKAAYDYAEQNHHSKWEDAWKLYNNERVKYGYKGVSDAFIPETHTIVESLVANIAGGKPKFSFIPTNEEQEQDTDVLNHMMDYFWEANRMNVKSQIWVRDMLLYGTGVLHVTWDGKKPVIDNVPLRDFFVDPNGIQMHEPNEPGYARYAGMRYLGNLDQMKKEEVWDPEQGKYVKKYKGLDDVTEMNQKWEDLDKQVKEMYKGSTLKDHANQKQVEVILTYYPLENRLVEVANRTVIIRDTTFPFSREARKVTREAVIDGVPTQVPQEVPEIKPFYPFGILRDYIDGSLFYGKGEVEVIKYRQEALNDLENQDNDNISYANNIMWQIDPQFADMAPEIESIPGAVYPLPKGALTPIERPVLKNDLEMKKVSIKDEMRRATAADEVIQGVSSEKGRVTATEVQTQLNQATQRFSTKINNLESEGYAQLGMTLFRIVQVFVDGDMVVRIVGDDGVEFAQFNPMQFVGDYEPHVKLDTTIRQAELEQDQKMNQMYQVILGNPTVDQREATRFILEKLGADDDQIQKMLMAPQPFEMNQVLQEEAAGGGQTPATGP